jgi:hypothetical protein
MFMALEFWTRGQCMWEVSAHFERKVSKKTNLTWLMKWVWELVGA